MTKPKPGITEAQLKIMQDKYDALHLEVAQLMLAAHPRGSQIMEVASEKIGVVVETTWSPVKCQVVLSVATAIRGRERKLTLAELATQYIPL